MAHPAPLGLVLLAVVLVGCSGATSTAAPGSSEVPTPAGVASAAATSVAPPTPGPTTTPTAGAQATPDTVALVPDSVAVSVATSVVLRSRPEVSTASEIFKPSLSEGDQVFVVDGPVRASGYDWYDVRPLSARLPSAGWVAAASRSGEPWLVPGVATCPPTPATYAELAALTSGQQLGCFSRVPITMRARVVRFVGSVDPGYNWVPDWFGTTGYLLVDPAATAPSSTLTGLFFLVLDPAGAHPDPLPDGKVVTVTGMYDHPAGADCTATLASPPEILVDLCRYQFAVTAMK